jgi:integrase
MLPKASLLPNNPKGDQMKFDKRNIETLPLPPDQHRPDIIYFDTALPGFGLRCRQGGRRVFIVQYRAGHRQRRETLGDARTISLEQARSAARKRLAEVALGGDPMGEKAAAKARAAFTLGRIADQYLERMKPTWRANTYNANRRYLTNHWGPLRDQPLHVVTRRDVAARIGELIDKHGVVAAARARDVLAAFYGFAIREGLADENPVAHTNNPAAGRKPRDRVLNADELKAVWNASGEEHGDFGTICKLLILLGCRRSEISGLRRSEVDFERGVLTIPRERTKNHRALVLPLPPLALGLLRATPRRDGDHVFGKSDGFKGWSYAALALYRRVAVTVPPFTLHDLRRSTATHMAELGVAPHVVEACLGHAGHRSGISGVYNKSSYQREVAQALALWGDYIAALVEGRERRVVMLPSVA